MRARAPLSTADNALDPGPKSAAERPFAVVVAQAGAQILHGTDLLAAAAGLYPGMSLADARARLPSLVFTPADVAAEAAALRRLAAWCERWSPRIAMSQGPRGLDGFVLDATNLAHLFGGEAGLLTDLLARLRGLGVEARAAIADSAAAAWAGARFDVAALSPTGAIWPAGETGRQLAQLPIEALDLPANIVAELKILGVKTVRALQRLPRAELARRFGPEPGQALDAALGAAPEGFEPIIAPHPVRVRLRAEAPVISDAQIFAALEKGLARLQVRLTQKDLGARLLSLRFYRTDGALAETMLRLARPEREAAIFSRLARERLATPDCAAALGAGVDAGGFDLIELLVAESAPFDARQAAFAAPSAPIDPRDAGAALAQTLDARLGMDRAQGVVFFPEWLPEEASKRAGFAQSGPATLSPGAPGDPLLRPRPLFLLAAPEPIEAMAEAPDGPPWQFRWRRRLHRVARAEGPERLAPNWRTETAQRTRDYYRVETPEGRRFWVFRAGFYGDSPAPRWYLHGIGA